MKTSTVEHNSDTQWNDGKVYLVDKPRGWSSFDVAAKMRGILQIKKIGHAGSLDCNATGLLIVCTGKMTKQIERFQSLEKEYVVTMRLGERTASFDTETPVTEKNDISSLTQDSIVAVVTRFVGVQKQVPPMWSAAKVSGKRLYDYARKGLEVERSVREVFIKSIGSISISAPDVMFTVVCSKGTYIRTLVNDIGNALNVGAHVTALRRTRIGDYHVMNAVAIDEVIQNIHNN